MAPLQSEIEQFTARNLPWNFSVNLIDITFITLGLSLISQETIMPLFVSTLTDSRIAIGLIPAVFNLGYYLPQLLTASFTESLQRKKPFVLLLGGLGERLPYLLIGLAAFVVQSPTLMLILFFLFLGLSAVGSGVATPAWFSLIGKVLPVHRRGIFFGLSGGLGALMGIIGSYFVGQMLEFRAYPENFALLFIVAFAFAALSWVGLALTREPQSLVVKQVVQLRHYLRQLPNVLRHNRAYRRFLMSYSVSKMGALASGFFVVYGSTQFALTGTEVGLLTGVLVGSQALSNLIWGWLGDRIGHKLVLTGSAFVLAAAALVALTATSASALIATFALLGAAIAGDQVSRFNIVLEFATPEDQPTFIGLTNTLLAPVVALAPILGGWLATVFDFRVLFLSAVLIAGTGGLLLLFWVQEPRTLTPMPMNASRDV